MIVNYGPIEIKEKCKIKEGYLDISDYGITLIQGENGIGKTLLAKNIFQKCRKENVKVSMIDQSNVMILRNETVIVNISMSYEVAEQERVKKIIVENGLEKILYLNSSKLSGGEKRIISILRELVKSNDLLIIDEPTNDLSDEWCDLILDLIRKYSSASPVIVISHDERLKSISNTVVTVSKKEGIIQYKKNDIDIAGRYPDAHEKERL